MTEMEKALRGLLKAIEGVGYQSPKLNRAVAAAIRTLPPVAASEDCERER